MFNIPMWLYLFLVIRIISSLSSQDLRYFPNWESIDSRPLPDWYDEGKVGIFLHWGVYSVPGMHSEWFWWNWNGVAGDNDVKKYINAHYSPTFKYADFATNFGAYFFDPNKWADIFEKSGAHKHHEGFTMYPSNYSFNWNSLDIGELAQAVRNKTKLKFGLYYSLFEWFHPLYLIDKQNNFTTKKYVEAVSAPQIKEIVENYLPEVLWLDGDVGPPEYWESLDTLAWLYNDSPVRKTIVTNDRWGTGCPCHHGGYFTCEDKFIPNQLMPRKWENCMTLDRSSWGFRKNMDINDVLSIQELLLTLIKTVSFGGNILINVGPTQDGMIDPIFEERLLQLGTWLNINGDAIYGTKPYDFQKEPYQDIWYTTKKTMMNNSISPNIYAIFKDWPEYENGYFVNLTMLNIPKIYSTTSFANTDDDVFDKIESVSSSYNQKNDIGVKVSLLGYNENTNLPWKYSNFTKDKHTFSVDLSSVILPKVLPNHAWTIKIEFLKGSSLFPIKTSRDLKNDILSNSVLK